MSTTNKILLGIAATGLTLILWASNVSAGECNGPGDDNCCQVGDEVVPVGTVCSNVVNANTEAYCGSAAAAQAQAICGSVSLVCPTVTVQDTISRCKSVKVLKSGVIRKRGCVSFLGVEEAICE